jgi:hypothetical protein
MQTGSISKDDAWLAVDSTVWRTLSNPLATTNVSKEQLEAIQTLYSYQRVAVVS